MLRSPAKKTPEELELENEHLRASLDALAVHTQEVESRNKQLREQAAERDKTMRSVVMGVRREVSAIVHSRRIRGSPELTLGFTGSEGETGYRHHEIPTPS